MTDNADYFLDAAYQNKLPQMHSGSALFENHSRLHFQN